MPFLVGALVAFLAIKVPFFLTLLDFVGYTVTILCGILFLVMVVAFLALSPLSTWLSQVRTGCKGWLKRSWLPHL